MDEIRTGPRHRSSVEAFENSNTIVELLARHRLVVAPHVASRLGLALGGDADAIIEVTTLLRTSQRLGLSVLPDPLPLVPAIAAAVGPQGDILADWERQALVIAAVCTDDRSDVLLAATGRSMSELVDGRLSRHLLLVAGHFAFADPRMRIWVHAEASLADRTAAHERLAGAYVGLGNDEQAVWHRSLATLEGSPDLVAPLLEIARRADAAGEAERAHAVAREAESHASGEQAALARRVAGRAALHGGFVEDAECWLGEVLAQGDDRGRASVLGESLVATALLHGDVAEAELDAQLEQFEQAAGTRGASQASRHARALVRAIAIAAGLLAERGAMQRAARRLDQAAALIDRHGLPVDDWAVGHAWYRLFAGGGPDAEPSGAPAVPAAAAAAGPGHATSTGEELPDGAPVGGLRAIAIALERGLGGDPSGAVRWLGARRTATPIDECAAVTGFERSPLVRAERAVAIALLDLWAGEVSRAANGLRQAACDLPIAFAFAGLGAALARRLELVATGEIGPWARAVEATLPPTATCVRREDLVDRAVEAHLHGRRSEAETLVALADERARSGFGAGLHIPGLDAATEHAAHDHGATERSARPSPASDADRRGIARRSPDARLASWLRHRMRGIGRACFDAEYAAIAEQARSIRSPYERARTELMLARVCAASGAVDAAARHLVAAEHLFADCGATGWLRAVAAERVAQIAARRGAAASVTLAGEARTATAEATRPQAPSVAGATGPSDAGAVGRGPAASEDHAPGDMLDECRAAWAEVLTERELEVAMLVVEGCSNREAASRLYVSVRTVEVHVGRVFTKLSVHSRVELAVLAHRMHGRLSSSRT
ncbi:regulatory protein, luxR family [Agromyces sp. CF514]|uniref:helix-turn-helix domain-containing protein n=1 Tax=Agromyces sp. CF514 TaxID=1881031 RepID=UPI0008E39B77|nr:helix-turn-helix transcriptional regulator [Agromyces sp. CF514]SFR72814.1 regulatory protein, luxR family [Agromyces sp. CF514]